MAADLHLNQTVHRINGSKLTSLRTLLSNILEFGKVPSKSKDAMLCYHGKRIYVASKKIQAKKICAFSVASIFKIL